MSRAVAWYREQGMVVEAVLTDDGVAERFIQTLLRQWAYRYIYPSSAHRAYRYIYPSSAHRARALSGWLRWYNRRRPHGSLGGLPPVSRVSHLCGHYI